MPSHTIIKILTINTHKGFTAFNRRFSLPALRDALRATLADVVCLQEVSGEHQTLSREIPGWPTTSHYEYLADTVWRDYAYGRNAVYPEGHHGNAVLSRFPIEYSENIDVSIEGHEQRGLLYCRIALPGQAGPLHVICVHLGLKEAHRQAQLNKLWDVIRQLPDNAPLVVAGDFNDWRQRLHPRLHGCDGIEEVFSREFGRPARTFPVWQPLLRLDRIYVRHVQQCQPLPFSSRPWRGLSDHAPLAVEISL